MTLQVAIIADDLTGALDTGTPFVEAGLTRGGGDRRRGAGRGIGWRPRCRRGQYGVACSVGG